MAAPALIKEDDTEAFGVEKAAADRGSSTARAAVNEEDRDPVGVSAFFEVEGVKGRDGQEFLSVRFDMREKTTCHKLSLSAQKVSKVGDLDHIFEQGFGIGCVWHIEANDDSFGESAQEKVAEVGFVVKDSDDIAGLSEVIDDGLFVDAVADLEVGFEDDACIDSADGKAVALEGLDGSDQHIGGIASRQIGGDGLGLVDADDKFDGPFGGEIVEEVGVGKKAIEPEVLDLL